MYKSHTIDCIANIPVDDTAILLSMAMLWRRREAIERELLRLCHTDITCAVGQQKVLALRESDHFADIIETFDD